MDFRPNEYVVVQQNICMPWVDSGECIGDCGCLHPPRLSGWLPTWPFPPPFQRPEQPIAGKAFELIWNFDLGQWRYVYENGDVLVGPSENSPTAAIGFRPGPAVSYTYISLTRYMLIQQ
jgi:hypothetical protein